MTHLNIAENLSFSQAAAQDKQDDENYPLLQSSLNRNSQI